MALHNLKIIVVDGGRAGSYKDKNASGNKINNDEKEKIKNSPLYKALHLKDNLKKKAESSLNPTTMFAMNMGVQLATQFVKQVANYYISDIGRKNGDSNYQAIINRQVEVITDGANIFQGILSGAAAGSSAGPHGAVIGAVLGAVSSVASIGFRQAERERSYAHQMFLDRNSQSYNLARAGYNALNGRVR